MFEAAIEAGTAAARCWTPTDADPDSGHHCCELCIHRYRVLVLDGPLGELPHGVTHVIVRTIDATITARCEETLEHNLPARSSAPVDRDASPSRLQHRLDAARGSLVLLALEELGTASPRLSDLRRCYTEPAVLAFLRRHRIDEVPEAWG